jgi:hypothetical protein
MSTKPSLAIDPHQKLRGVLGQMYRPDLLKIATALGAKPRSDHYRDSRELIELIVEWADYSLLKDDWLLRVEVPWTMYQPLPCLEELEHKSYEQLSVVSLREICRQYAIAGYTKITTKAVLARKVKQMVEDSKHYHQKIYRSRHTKEPIPEEELILPQSPPVE